MATLFDTEFEQQAIDRIQRFAKIASKMGYIPVLGFSGGKDSQVCYDLCKRSGIEFKAVFNHCFESATTLNFIRKYYPEVIWRREVKEGFFENIRKNHNGLLPTVECAFCCEDYKHNRKYVDGATIVGVRKEESAKRKGRKVMETKNKTLLKRNRQVIYEHFTTGCVASGAPSEINLNPIVDWSSDDIWDYIHRYKLPINPEYRERERVGCVICPKATFTSNYKVLLQYPKLIDCVIRAKERSNNPKTDYIITSDNKDCSDNKAEYVCRWLNHSFRAFTKKQRILADMVVDNYNKMKAS